MGVDLRPQKNFTVVRQLANHTDTSTYYVRSVIRNAHTDAILDTLNLDDQGDQRFTKNWKVPADVSGEGFYVSIVTSVYTDSDYTTKSENYGDEENTHRVIEPPSNLKGGFSGGGVDASTVKRIIEEVMDSRTPKLEEVAEQEMPEPIEVPEMPFGEVLSMLGYIADQLDTLPREKPNFAPIIDKISRIEDAIENLPEPTEPTDLSPVMDQLMKKDEKDDLTKEDLKTALIGANKDMTDEIKSSVEEALSKTNFVTSFVTHAVSDKVKAPQPNEMPESKPIDIKKLTS